MSLRCFRVARVGHDPTTSGLWIRRSNQLSYLAIMSLVLKDSARVARAILLACGGRTIFTAFVGFADLVFCEKVLMKASFQQIISQKTRRCAPGCKFVEIEGFEPSLTEPESVVLPLHHISIGVRSKSGLQRYNTFANLQKNQQEIFSRSSSQL